MKRRGFFSSPHIVCMQSFCLLHIVCLSITSPNRAKTAFKREKKMSLSPFNFLILAERKNLGVFSPQNYCKPRSFPIFQPEIEKSKRLEKSKFKENLRDSKTMACIWCLGNSHRMDSFNRQVTSTGWKPMKCSNKHQPQGTHLLPSRLVVTRFPFEALLLPKLKLASNSSFCFFRNPVWLGCWKRKQSVAYTVTFS